MTRAASPHSGPSMAHKTHEQPSATKQSWVRSLADWFNTGTAAVKFAKALVGFLAFLGIITVGGVIAGIGGGNLSAALLQPSDLGVSGALGWSQTQVSPGTPSSCPTYPPDSDQHVITAMSDAASGDVLSEEVWKLTDPDQAISAYVSTAQNCSFAKNAENTVTYQQDDSDGSYGQDSAIETLGVTNLPGETPTIGAYDALIARGDLLAEVHLTTGTEGSIDESTLTSIFTKAAEKL